MRHVAVVVEMIAGQIGKASSGNREAVEAKLGETMARRLDRDVLDPLFAEGGEIAVEGDRVGRRQRARAAPARPHQPERADTRREMAAGGPDLTNEMGDGGLAVGAGDGCDRSRLPAAKARRELRQPAIGVRIGHDPHPSAIFRREAERRSIVGQDRDRATRHRIAGE